MRSSFSIRNGRIKLLNIIADLWLLLMPGPKRHWCGLFYFVDVLILSYNDQHFSVLDDEIGSGDHMDAV